MFVVLPKAIPYGYGRQMTLAGLRWKLRLGWAEKHNTPLLQKRHPLFVDSDAARLQSGRKVRGFADSYFARRHTLLFATLMIALVLGPIAQELRLRDWALEIWLLISVGVAAAGISSSRGRNWAFLAVALIVSLRVLGRELGTEAVSQSAAALFVGLALLAAISCLRFALRGKRVDRERLTAALSTYLLAGYMYGVCYLQIQHLRAGTFAVSGAPVLAGALKLQDCLYFSFVTLTTLGYGDISPLTPTARGLAVSEAIVGQLFLAVLVARLVGGTATNE